MNPFEQKQILKAFLTHAIPQEENKTTLNRTPTCRKPQNYEIQIVGFV
jgi:hypothetical protein